MKRTPDDLHSNRFARVEAMSQQPRAYYLDWIRIIVILLLVPFHSAVTFATHGDGFIRYPQHAPLLDGFLWFLSIWIMPVLFLVSGVSAYFALQTRTPAQFARERRAKLLLPLVAGVLLVCPPMSYLRARFMGSFHGGLIEFYPHFFQGVYPRGNLNWGHLWFLAYLFVFTLILLPLFVRIRTGHMKARITKASAVLERRLWIYLLALPLMLTESVLRPMFPGLQNLVWDWANFVLYLVLVFYGFVFAINGRISENIQRIRAITLCIAIALFAGAVASRLYGVSLAPFYPAYNVLMVFSWMFAVLGYAKARLNTKSGVYAYLNEASFPFYIFHFLPITVAAYFIAGSSSGVWLKWILLIVVSYPATIGLYEVVKRIPYLRTVFGIKRQRA
jgi:glucans biosynthesis protein C